MAKKIEFRRKSYNPKRRIVPEGASVDCKAFSERIGYGGNPEHKRNPGDFGLKPPSAAEADSTLCDWTGVFTKEEALAILRAGALQGLISVQTRNGFPQNIWSVTKGMAIEADLENEVLGIYHGYPLKGDPFEKEVLRRWKPNE